MTKTTTITQVIKYLKDFAFHYTTFYERGRRSVCNCIVPEREHFDKLFFVVEYGFNVCFGCESLLCAAEVISFFHWMLWGDSFHIIFVVCWIFISLFIATWNFWYDITYYLIVHLSIGSVLHWTFYSRLGDDCSSVVNRQVHR